MTFVPFVGFKLKKSPETECKLIEITTRALAWVSQMISHRIVFAQYSIYLPYAL